MFYEIDSFKSKAVVMQKLFNETIIRFYNIEYKNYSS